MRKREIISTFKRIEKIQIRIARILDCKLNPPKSDYMLRKEAKQLHDQINSQEDYY